MCQMRTKKLRPYAALLSQTCIAIYLVGCDSPFVSFKSSDGQVEADAQAQESDDAGYKATGGKPIIPRKETVAPKGTGGSTATIPESSVDAGSEPDATIRIQDSGRPEIEVKEAAVPIPKEAATPPPPKPWYLTNPDGVCVPGNPKMCASGCSCPHNGLPWCCI